MNKQEKLHTGWVLLIYTDCSGYPFCTNIC